MPGAGSKAGEGATVEQVLSLERLAEIRSSPRFKGTGGPEVPLPDGTTVSRDTIFEAIKPLVARGPGACPDLVRALRSHETHVRYGAYLALKLITRSEKAYYPFFSPEDPKNLDAFREWESFVEQGGCEK